MNKKISVFSAIALVILACALTISVTMVVATRHFNLELTNVQERQEMFKYITEIDKAVRQNYIGTIDEEQLRSAIARGYVDGVDDPYALYLSAAEYRKEMERLDGKWTGLGLEVQQLDKLLVINAVHKNSAAEKAGLNKGDILVSVDGNSAVSLGYKKVKEILDSSQKVLLTVKRNTEEIAFEISSSTYTATTVEYRMIGTTGYIRISAFYSNTPARFKEAYTKLAETGAQNYIFDLRFNTGGALNAADEIISYIIPRGTYAHTTDTNGNRTPLVSDDTFEMTSSSVTLVNEKTSEVAELFAGVLREFKKTTVVGTQTAGHGLLQQYFKITADGSAVKLSVSNMSLASGALIEEVGIVPDITSGLSAEQERRFAFLTESDDTQLATALTILKGGSVSTSTTASATTTTSATKATTTTKASTTTTKLSHSTHRRTIHVRR